MKRYLFISLFMLALTGIGQAHAASRVLFDGFMPATLGVSSSPSNAPEDDPFRYFQIYLPDGYDSYPDRRYPVVYFLHGFGQNYSSYSEIFSQLDGQIAAQKLKPVIVVKVDGSILNGWLGSLFVNSTLNGNFEDYIVQELRTYVNRNYRTKTDPGSTQIAGHSVGGYAAILLGLRHPEVYGKITAHAPSTIVAMQPQISNPDFYRGVLEEIPATGPSAGKVLPTNGRNTYMLFALAAALSPNAATQPFGLDLPIKVNPDFSPILLDNKLQANGPVVDIWLQKDPYALISGSQSLQDQLKNQSLYIDYGDHETGVDTTGAQLLEGLLTALQIPYVSSVCKGSCFSQADLYTPSNDIPESQVHPALSLTASLLVPSAQQPKLLVDFVIRAINANPQEFDAVTLNNFGGFLSVVCGIQNPPQTTGDLLVDPQFLSCLAANNIDPTQFVADYFTIPGYISIDPILFSIDTDGCKPCGKNCSTNCPALLFQ